MPIYDFMRKRKGRAKDGADKEIVSAQLSYPEFDIYSSLVIVLGEYNKMKNNSGASEAETKEPERTLYDLLMKEPKKPSSGGNAKKHLTFGEFESAYKKFTSAGIIYNGNGRINALPRIYDSPEAIIFRGPGFYSTDNRNGKKISLPAKKD